MKRKTRGRLRVLLAAAAALAAGGEVWGTINFDKSTSTLTLTHDPDITLDTNGTPLVVEPTPVPTSASIYPVSPSYQISSPFYLSGASSFAQGSLGQVTNSTTGSFVLAAGTGVAQTDPGPTQVYPGASSLKFNVNLWWNVGPGGFRPLANGYASITEAGVVGSGGSAELHINLSFKNQAG